MGIRLPIYLSLKIQNRPWSHPISLKANKLIIIIKSKIHIFLKHSFVIILFFCTKQSFNFALHDTYNRLTKQKNTSSWLIKMDVYVSNETKSETIFIWKKSI